MNRPKIEDYQKKIEIENGWEARLEAVKYRIDLEKYCDELEKELDNACLELELSNKQLRELDNRFLPMTKKDWKEYLLKDE